MARAKRAETARPEQFLELYELLSYVRQVVDRGIPGAVWVQAEIASLTDRRHLYLDLVQQGDDGQEVAKARANIWARERYALEGKFQRATGGGFTAGIKVLLMVTPEFHPQYGFSLTVLDAVPEFTVGDLQQKLMAIREALSREGLYGLNRALELPADFTRVAVLSPVNAAGLGDFRREADRLQAAGVVDFVYFGATFQGREAPPSLLAALGAAQLAHAAEPFDALVILRGGGASTDLAWLSDLEVARAVARFPAPVITGIGHARDDTILDEIAAVRCDTPSKAAALLLAVVAQAARDAEEAYGQIRTAGQAALHSAEQTLAWSAGRVRRAARSATEREGLGVDNLMRTVLGLTPERTLARGYALVRGEAGQVMGSAAAARGQRRLSLRFSDGELDVRPE